MDKEEKLHKELDLIQSCITRMANNSFMIKGWTLTLFVALITFFNLKDLPDVILIFALISVVFLFSYLDAFYLWQERKYVQLYSDVIEKREKGNFTKLYSLSTKDYNTETIFDVINNKRCKLEYLKEYPEKKFKAWWNAQKRNTIGIFYGSLVLFICLYSIISIYSFNKSVEKQEYEITIKEANLSIDKMETCFTTLSSNVEKLSTNVLNNQDEILKIEEQLKNSTTTINKMNADIQKIKGEIEQKK